ncbi:MAG: cytochrome c-type biogenesis protein CcmH [Candidatus Acidiferrales bacterium]|jgi:cytochrome c-type biogenesis protein CcmH
MIDRRTIGKLRRSRSIRVAAVFFLLLPSLAGVARGQSSDRAKRVGGKLLCVCGCNQILTACNHVGCTYSHGMLQEVDDRVARNEPDDLTIQAFVQEYGATVLAEPENTGFNRAAWIMPVVLPLLGIALVWIVVRRWRERALLVPAAGVSPEMLARARREGDRDIDE